jgi:4-amino-4-deoxy-L-arabinose transferase-like glycosyltransferase
MLLLLITIPSVILQASSVTNNIIESVFVLIALLYALKILQESNLSNFIFFGLAAGFCLLTKGTAYIFIGPIFLITGLHLMCLKKKAFYSIGLMTLSLVICLLINTFHYQRNFILTGNILGTNKIESQKYSNEKFSVINLTSNTIKNIGINLGPFPLNKIAEKGIYTMHQYLGIDINAPGSNFDDFIYSITSAPNSEDNAPNFLHLLLGLFCLVKIFSKARAKQISINTWFFIGVVFLQFLLFNLVLKWQPWHARNQIALFFEFVPLTALFVIDVISKRSLKILFFVLVLYAVTLIVFNRIRPLYSHIPLTNNIGIKSNREIKYYADRMVAADEFQKIDDIINKEKNIVVGVNIFWNEYEYPFFRNCYRDNIKPFHILNDDNPSKNIDRIVLIPDYIVSTRTYLNNLDFNSNSYTNLTLGNTYISLYKKNK